MALFSKDKKEEEKNDNEPNTKDVVDAITKLGEGFSQGFQSMNGSIQRLQQNLSDRAAEDASPPDDTETDMFPKDTDLEKLTTQEILDAVTKTVERAMQGTDRKIQESQLINQKERLRDELDALSKSDPLFKQLEGKMAEIVTKNPSLAVNPQHLLMIAKAENSDIVEAFQKTQDNETQKEEEEKEAESRSFGGLVPGSSGVGEAEDKSEGLNLKDAAAKAWEETMKDVPTSVIGGNA